MKLNVDLALIIEGLVSLRYEPSKPIYTVGVPGMSLGVKVGSKYETGCDDHQGIR